MFDSFIFCYSVMLLAYFILFFVCHSSLIHFSIYLYIAFVNLKNWCFDVCYLDVKLLLLSLLLLVFPLTLGLLWLIVLEAETVNLSIAVR